MCTNAGYSISLGWNVTISLSGFSTMSPDDQAKVITAALSTKVPPELNENSDIQKLLYAMKSDTRPELVDDEDLKKIKGKTLYRTVNSNADLSAQDIATMTMHDKQLRYPHNGWAVYGSGIYFADSKSGAKAYGHTKGDAMKSCVMKAKFKSDAKVINYYTAYKGAYDEIAKGTKLGKALMKCEGTSVAGIYALCKGYQAMDNQGGYRTVLDRSCLAMSKTVDAC